MKIYAREIKELVKALGSETLSLAMLGVLNPGSKDLLITCAAFSCAFRQYKKVAREMEKNGLDEAEESAEEMMFVTGMLLDDKPIGDVDIEVIARLYERSEYEAKKERGCVNVESKAQTRMITIDELRALRKACEVMSDSEFFAKAKTIDEFTDVMSFELTKRRIDEVVSAMESLKQKEIEISVERSLDVEKILRDFADYGITESEAEIIRKFNSGATYGN